MAGPICPMFLFLCKCYLCFCECQTIFILLFLYSALSNPRRRTVWLRSKMRKWRVNRIDWLEVNKRFQGFLVFCCSHERNWLICFCVKQFGWMILSVVPACCKTAVVTRKPCLFPIYENGYICTPLDFDPILYIVWLAMIHCLYVLF